MDIQALRAFVAVAKFGSFSKAANELNLTQPAVSKRVAALESELDCQLFNRTARKVAMTDIGERILPLAETLLEQSDQLVVTAKSLSDEVSGTLRIAVSHHIGLYRMPKLFRQFHDQYPKVHLDILFVDSEKGLALAEQSEIDFAVITLPRSIPTRLAAQIVWRDELFFVCGNEHVLASEAQTSFEALSKTDCLLPERDTETYQIALREFSHRDWGLAVKLQTNNLETLKMLCAAGLGWTLLPQTMIDESLASLDVGISLNRKLGIVSHHKRHLSTAGKAMSELLVNASKV